MCSGNTGFVRLRFTPAKSVMPANTRSEPPTHLERLKQTVSSPFKVGSVYPGHMLIVKLRSISHGVQISERKKGEVEPAQSPFTKGYKAPKRAYDLPERKTEKIAPPKEEPKPAAVGRFR